MHLVLKENVGFKSADLLKKRLRPIGSFDWNARTSPLSALGGMKGVSKAYDLLSAKVGMERSSPKERHH